MEEELSRKFDQIKKDMVVSFAKFSLKGEEHHNQEAVLSSVLFSWCTGVETLEDFRKKYHSFKELEKMIQDSVLFDLVETITSKTRDYPQAKRAISIYEDFLKNPEYQKCSSLCGYKIPVEFGDEDSYFDGTLREKVSFYRIFTEHLDQIYKDLSVKGAVHR